MINVLRAVLWNPIVGKELRSRMRSWRVVAVLVGYLGIVGAIGYAAYASRVGDATNVQELGQAGRVVFAALAASVMLFVAVLVPGLVGGAISGERERQTLDLLLCTAVPPVRIIIGKLASSLAFVVLLLIASVPLFSAVFMLGGVSVDEVLVVTLVGLVTAVTLGALSMLCSVMLRRTTASVVSSYVVALLLFLLPVLAGVLMSVTGSHRGLVGPSYAMGPVYAASASASAVAPSTVPPPASFPGTPGNPGTVQSFPVERGGVDIPFVVVFSPPVAMVAALAADYEQAQCVGLPAGACSAQSTQLPKDALAAGLFEGWRVWAVFALFDTIVAALAVTASVLLLRGRVPGSARLARRHVSEAS